MPFERAPAIVTGGASGLGLAIAEAFVARGTNVAIFDVQRDERVVNISSSSVQGGQSCMAAYVSSKAGLIGLTNSLALELGAKGITVKGISPQSRRCAGPAGPRISPRRDLPLLR